MFQNWIKARMWQMTDHDMFYINRWKDTGVPERPKRILQS